MPEFDGDRDQVLTRARSQGLRAIINVSVDLESSQKSIHMAQQHDDVFATVGFHPNSTNKMNEGDLRVLGRLSANPKVLAIGEIGLDFYRKSSPRQRQLEAFQQQLRLAAELGLPVVIHCRNATKELLDIIVPWAKSILHSTNYRYGLGVMHCFSGDVMLAHRYIELGFLISLPASITYPSARDKIEIAQKLTLDKLLVETDAPFLPPQLYRGQRNEPSYVAFVVTKIAEVRRVPADTVAQATAQNAINLFHLSIESGN